MKRQTPTLMLTAALLAALGGGAIAGAQDEAEGIGSELGIGLYLGNCDALVAGAALYDLGDAEQETENFADADENATADDEEPDLESELEGESGGDETDVEGAIDAEDESGDPSDRQVVVQDANFLVWVNSGVTFGAGLVDLVDAPFAIAVRQDAQDGTGGEDGEDFLACGTFGGAVAGNELVLPLRPLNDSGFTGISVLAQGEGDGESVSSLYLYRDAEEGEISGEADATDESADDENADEESADEEATEEPSDADATEEAVDEDATEEPSDEDVDEEATEESTDDADATEEADGEEATQDTSDEGSANEGDDEASDEELADADATAEPSDEDGDEEAAEADETPDTEAAVAAVAEALAAAADDEPSEGGIFVTPTPVS